MCWEKESNILKLSDNTLIFNGERLRTARLYRGLTVNELAEIVGLKRQTISAYENNQDANPLIDYIHKISLVLKFPFKFFYETYKVNINDGSTYFRAQLTTNKRYRAQKIEKARFIAIIYKYLNEYINFPPQNIDIDLYESLNTEESAYQLRKEWNLGDDPIKNINHIIESNGIIANTFGTDRNISDSFSNKTLIYKQEIVVIAYSKNIQTAGNIHFTIAHELGHIILHDWSEDVDSLSKQEFRIREKEANEFAYAFLMPKNSFGKEVSIDPCNFDHYLKLKKIWKVSISDMLRRSLSLGLISDTTYARMIMYMQKKGFMKLEPLDDKIGTGAPRVIVQAIELLFKKGIINAQIFLDELSNNFGLSMNGNELERILNLKKDFLKIEVKESPVLEFKIKTLRDREVN